jgi:hypothetical protein
MRWVWASLLALTLSGTGAFTNDSIGPPGPGPGAGITTVNEDDFAVSCTYDGAHGDPVTAEVYALANGQRVPYIQAAPVSVHPGANQMLTFKLAAHIMNVRRQGIQTQQLEFVLRDAKGNEFYSVKYRWYYDRPRGWPSTWFEDSINVLDVQSPSDSELEVTVYYQDFSKAGFSNKSICIDVLKDAACIPWIGSAWVPCQAGRHTVVIPVKLGTSCPAPINHPKIAPGPIQTTDLHVMTVAMDNSNGVVVTAGPWADRPYKKSWPAPSPTQLRLLAPLRIFKK